MWVFFSITNALHCHVKTLVYVTFQWKTVVTVKFLDIYLLELAVSSSQRPLGAEKEGDQ
jgi:hypothetical protein